MAGAKIRQCRSDESGDFERAVYDFKVKLIKDLIAQLPQDQQDRMHRWFPEFEEEYLHNIYYLAERSVAKVKQRQAEANSITQV
jgi:hypothetical protein